MEKRMWIILCIFIFFSFSLSGCYYFNATSEMKAAEKLISELKAAGGPTLVPYEYTLAEKLLEFSKEELAENDPPAASKLATRAKLAAQSGLDEIKKKK